MPSYRVIRIAMPDRPGALSAVTASLAAHGVDIVRLDVVSHEGAHVVDDLLVAAQSASDIGSAIGGFLPDVTVRTFDGLPGDPTIQMGAGLGDVALAEPARMQTALVVAARDLLRGDQAVLLELTENGRVEPLAATCSLPVIGEGEPFTGRWVLERASPVAFPATHGWATAAFEAATSAAWVAIAPCGPSRMLLISRSTNVAFYTGELERLQTFSEAADAILGVRGDRARVPVALAAGGDELPERAVRLQSRFALS